MVHSPEESDSNGQPSQTGEFEVSDFFVAPWGLANEQRPLHIRWEGEVEAVTIALPNPMKLDKVNNINKPLEEFDIEANEEYSEIEFSSSDIISEGYLAGELIVPEIFEDVMVGQEVGVKLHLPSGEMVQSTGYTFTIRPKIELVDAPDQIIVKESQKEVALEIDMRYIGFGMAEVEIEVQSDGETISEPVDLMTNIAEAFAESGVPTKESEILDDIPEEWENDPRYNVSQEDMQMLAADMREVFLEGRDAFEEFDVDQMLKIAKALEEGETDREWDISKMYEFMELALVNSILDLVDRHPTEGVKMENPNTEIETESQTREITVIYKLSDRQGNEYQSVEKTVEIIDENDREGMMRGTINTNWESHQINPDDALQQIMEDL